MNTNDVKAKIWNMCIQKGIFNKVKGDEFKEIQDLFEKIIKGYEQLQPSEEIFNKVIDSISLEIQNKSTSIPFETIQKEYDELLNTPNPKQIDFTMNTVNTVNMNDFDKPKIKLEEILMTQNKILIQILETQIKIIENLKI